MFALTLLCRHFWDLLDPKDVVASENGTPGA
jgi:hypothetical protein